MVMDRIIRGDTKDQIVEDLILSGLSEKEAMTLYSKTAIEFEKSKIVAINELKNYTLILMTDSKETKKSFEKLKDSKPKIALFEAHTGFLGTNNGDRLYDIEGMVNLLFALGYSEEKAIQTLFYEKEPELARNYVSKVYKALMSRPKNYIEWEKKHVLITKAILQGQVAQKMELIDRMILAGWSKGNATLLLNIIEMEKKQKRYVARKDEAEQIWMELEIANIKKEMGKRERE